jgi:hypothetical protein
MTKIGYAGYRFPPVIIQQAIWLYLRFTLSFSGQRKCLLVIERLRVQSCPKPGIIGGQHCLSSGGDLPPVVDWRGRANPGKLKVAHQAEVPRPSCALGKHAWRCLGRSWPAIVDAIAVVVAIAHVEIVGGADRRGHSRSSLITSRHFHRPVKTGKAVCRANLVV